MVRSTSCQRSSDSASGRRMDRPAVLIKMSPPPRRCSTSAARGASGPRTGRAPPVVVNQDAPPAEALTAVGDQRVDGIQIGQVAGDRRGVAAVFGDAADQLVEQILTAGAPAPGGGGGGGA